MKPVKPVRKHSAPPWPVGLAAELFAMVSVAAVCIMALGFLVPKHLLPWTPLAWNDPVTPLTPWKIAALRHDPSHCRALLAEAGVTVAEAPNRMDEDYCVVEDAVGLPSGGPQLVFEVQPPPPPQPGSPEAAALAAKLAADAAAGLPPPEPPGPRLVSSVPMMRCPVAVGLVLWHQRGLNPAAASIIGSRIKRIQHNGTYACRKMRTGDKRQPPRPSQHATANAIDIVGFEFENGRVLKLPGAWKGQEDETEDGAAFMKAARDSACQYFKMTLGPDYNALHADHLHLDMGGLRGCR
jgi:hypothetical protein